MRFVILHYHIFKNAGTTIEDFLDRSFGENFARFDTADRDARVLEGELLSFLHRNPYVKAVSSHQLAYPLPEAAGFAFFDLCFLRDPIDRLRSLYDYAREKPVESDPVNVLANRWSMSEFFSAMIDEFPWYVNDAQVNLLANGVVDRPATEADLDRAITRVLHTVFLGVVDRYRESVAIGQRWLRPIFPELTCEVPAANVSLSAAGSTMAERIERTRNACAPGIFEELLTLNQLDCVLVNRARAEIQGRLKSLEPIPTQA